jgi:hypothetical protein
MQLKLPRRPRIFAAHQASREAEPVTLPEDDPWAGEDDAWTTNGDDAAAQGPADAVRFFRGAALGVLVGALFWGLVALALLLWLD